MEESFWVNYFIPLVDQPISSLTSRLNNVRATIKYLVSYLPVKHCIW
jgi:hypothetical protein